MRFGVDVREARWCGLSALLLFIYIGYYILDMERVYVREAPKLKYDMGMGDRSTPVRARPEVGISCPRDNTTPPIT